MTLNSLNFPRCSKESVFPFLFPNHAKPELIFNINEYIPVSRAECHRHRGLGIFKQSSCAKTKLGHCGNKVKWIQLLILTLKSSFFCRPTKFIYLFNFLFYIYIFTSPQKSLQIKIKRKIVNQGHELLNEQYNAHVFLEEQKNKLDKE